MKVEQYRQILNNDRKSQEMTPEDFDNTLMHFAELYHQSKLKESLSDEQTIYVTNSSPSDVYAAFYSENRASIEAEECGCYTTKITLYKGQRI